MASDWLRSAPTLSRTRAKDEGLKRFVSPASNFVRAAEYAGARTIFVNLEAMTPHNPAFKEVVLGRAEDVLPSLLAPF